MASGLFDGLGCEFQSAIRILQLIFLEPLEIGAKQQGQIVQLVLKLRNGRVPGKGFEQPLRGELVLLQLIEELAELLGKARQARTGMEELELGVIPGQQSPEHHHAPFFIEDAGRRGGKLVENEVGQAIEGKNLQASVAGHFGVGQ